MPSAMTREQRKKTGDTIRPLAILGVFFFVITAAGYFYTVSWVKPIPRDATTLVVGRDFLNFWMYGHTAFAPDPGRFYDPALYNQALTALLGPGYFGQHWSYPPSIMLLAAPFGRLNYLPALLCWTLAGLAIFITAVRRHLDDPWLLLTLLVSPAAVICIISGQSSLLTTAALIAIFASLDRRPLLAGTLIGLLTLKPQVGIFLPVLLVASGRRRVFVIAAATAVLLAALTALLFGPQVWIDYVLKSIPVQNSVLNDPDRLASIVLPTIFMNMRDAGVPYALAMGVQVCFSLLAAGAIFWAYRFRAGADPRMLAALFFACSVGGSPYLLSYDTLPLAFAALVLLASGKLDPLGGRMVQLVYWLPLLQFGLGTFHIPGPALIAPAFAVYLIARIADRSRARRTPPAFGIRWP